MSVQISDKWFFEYFSGSQGIARLNGLAIIPDNTINSINVVPHAKRITEIKGETVLSTHKNSFMQCDGKPKDIFFNGLSYRLKSEMHQEDLSIIRSSYSSQPLVIDNQYDKIVAIGGNSNFAHFLFEYMPKILTAASISGENTLFTCSKSIVKWLPIASFIVKKCFGYNLKILPIDTKSIKSYKCKNPLVVESTFSVGASYFINHDALKLANSTVVEHFGGYDNGHNSKIYLMRVSNQNTWRNLSNKSEIRSFFKRNGFNLVQMANLPLLKQLQLMAHATHVVVEGGADSFITIFCPPGAKIIELLPLNFVNGFGPLTSSLCLSQKYTRISGKRLKTNLGATSIDNDYFIDITNMKKSIDNLL